LIYELKYYDETGEHLDINNSTLCAGSRYSSDKVPYVRWRGGELRVDWCGSGAAAPHLRARVVAP